MDSAPARFEFLMCRSHTISARSSRTRLSSPSSAAELPSSPSSKIPPSSTSNREYSSHAVHPTPPLPVVDLPTGGAGGCGAGEGIVAGVAGVARAPGSTEFSGTQLNGYVRPSDQPQMLFYEIIPAKSSELAQQKGNFTIIRSGNLEWFPSVGWRIVFERVEPTRFKCKGLRSKKKCKEMNV
jgi:hypothetical protein